MLRLGFLHASNSGKVTPFFLPSVAIQVSDSFPTEEAMKVRRTSFLPFTYPTPVETLPSLFPSVTVQHAIHLANPYAPHPIGSFGMDLIAERIRGELGPLPAIEELDPRGLKYTGIHRSASPFAPHDVQWQGDTQP